MTQTQVPTNTLDAVLDYVEVSSLALKTASDEVEGHRQAQTKAAALRGPLVDRLISTGLVPTEKKAQAELMLGGHDTSLKVMNGLIDLLVESKSEKTATALGEPVNDPAQAKTASDGQPTPATRFIGEQTTEVRGSDRPLLALIGR